MSTLQPVWAEKYRPKSLDEYVFQNESHKQSFEKFIEQKSIPHLLFSGVQGSGKTALAKILMSSFDLDESDLLIINASEENNVDTMRTKIKDFISTFALSGFKVVLLDEADGISPAGQGALRAMMIDYIDNARFILTCNYEHKIIPALKSRIQEFHFKSPDPTDVTETVTKILLKEKVKFDLDLVDKYVSVYYPDIRKIITALEGNTHNGVLTQPTVAKKNEDYRFKLIDLLESNDWEGARKVCCENVAKEEWEDVYRFLYDNLHKVPKFKKQDKWSQGIVTIAEYLYRHPLCADPEINAAAMFIALGMI